MEFEFEGMTVETAKPRLPKGYMFKNVYDFMQSGDEHIILSDLPLIGNMNIGLASVASAAKREHEKIESKYTTLPKCVLAKNEVAVVLVNVAVYEARKAAEAAQNES